jgi:hypothetical protein
VISDFYLQTSRHPIPSSCPTSAIARPSEVRYESTARDVRFKRTWLAAYPAGGTPATRSRRLTSASALGEGQDRKKARHNRDLPNTGQPEAEEDHVARHVRNEHMSQPQVTERVHKAGHHRQANQEQRQRPVRWVSGPLGHPHKNQSEGLYRIYALRIIVRVERHRG